MMEEREAWGVRDDRTAHTCRDTHPRTPSDVSWTEDSGSPAGPPDIRKLSDTQIACCHTRLSDSVDLGCGQETARLTSSQGLPLVCPPATPL